MPHNAAPRPRRSSFSLTHRAGDPELLSPRMHTLLDDHDRDSLMVQPMGVWGTGVFENDAACDWSADLADASDLTFVTDTLSSAQEVDDDELDVELGCTAVAACEVIARLQGRVHARGSSNN